MSKMKNLSTRIEPSIKEEAESILAKLGISTSSAITMFYKQIILNNGIPFDIKVPKNSNIEVNTLPQEQLNIELEKGYEDMLNGNVKPAEEVFAMIRKNGNK